MSKLIQEKIKTLRELGFKLTYLQLNQLRSCKTEMQLDRVAHSIICPQMVSLQPVRR